MAIMANYCQQFFCISLFFSSTKLAICLEPLVQFWWNFQWNRLMKCTVHITQKPKIKNKFATYETMLHLVPADFIRLLIGHIQRMRWSEAFQAGLFIMWSLRDGILTNVFFLWSTATGPQNFEFCKTIESIWKLCEHETVNVDYSTWKNKTFKFSHLQA